MHTTGNDSKLHINCSELMTLSISTEGNGCTVGAKESKTVDCNAKNIYVPCHHGTCS